MTEETQANPEDYRAGLKKIRQRRCLLWLTILIYVPAMMIALNTPDSGKAIVTVFIGWIIFLCITVALAALIRCPRCGDCFHTNGPTFLPLRRCLHCGLHVTADRIKAAPPQED